MDTSIRVWTKQHVNILEDLEKNGRFIAKKEYIQQKMENFTDFYLDVYEWYKSKAKSIVPIPEDANYPIWVSLKEEEKIKNEVGTVLLELEIDKSSLITIDLEKWGLVVNYMYIAKDAEDQREHDREMATYGINDTRAYISPFYPAIKKKIRKSWDRLFDEEIILSPMKVGTIWELKKEWIVEVHK